MDEHQIATAVEDILDTICEFGQPFANRMRALFEVSEIPVVIREAEDGAHQAIEGRKPLIEVQSLRRDNLSSDRGRAGNCPLDFLNFGQKLLWRRLVVDPK